MKPHRALACLCLCAWIIPGAESLAVQKCTTLCAQPPSQKLRAGEGPGPATATAQGSARWVAGIPELALGDVRSIVSELHAQMLHTKDQLLAASVPEMEHILDRIKVTFGAKIAFRDALIELQQNITRDAERDRRLGKDPRELIHWLHPPPAKRARSGAGGRWPPSSNCLGLRPKRLCLQTSARGALRPPSWPSMGSRAPACWSRASRSCSAGASTNASPTVPACESKRRSGSGSAHTPVAWRGCCGGRCARVP